MKMRIHRGDIPQDFDLDSITSGRATKYQPKITKQQIASVAKSLDTNLLTRGNKDYSNWHWGDEPVNVIDWDDDTYPEYLVTCGNLVRIHFRAVRGEADDGKQVKGPAGQLMKKNKGHPRREKDTMIELARPMAAKSFLTFDPSHSNQRLYLLITPEVAPILAEKFWHDNTINPLKLSTVASIAGGRQGMSNSDAYPDLWVKPIGLCTALVYHTLKKGDGASYYIHNVGEITGKFPIICCDELGRLWLAGGDYTCPEEGITN